jgi:hypothetical protein
MSSNPFLTKELEAKRPDYLIQWRTSLWVSMREKESSVWKFVAFYAAAISLIIGLGQKLATTLDVTIDVAVTAALVGLLTFWGLAVIIDSNSWMARNLKLVGNIEKLFIPADQYGKLLPGYYSSPVFQYFRPYTINFFLLIILGLIAYINFLAHSPWNDQTWRQYLLPFITFVYVLGFDRVQALEADTRKEYFRFLENAEGEPIGTGGEMMPPKFREFQRATTARFQQWAAVASAFVILVYGLREQSRVHSTMVPWVLWVLLIVTVIYLAASFWLARQLDAKEKTFAGQTVNWATLNSEQLIGRQTVGRVMVLFFKFLVVCRYLLLVGIIILIALSYS